MFVRFILNNELFDEKPINEAFSKPPKVGMKIETPLGKLIILSILKSVSTDVIYVLLGDKLNNY